MGDAAVIQRVGLNDQVYDTIKARLLTRALGPRTKLRLQALADEFDVSRSPVQHALTRLVAEGLVEADHHGYFVRPLTAGLLAEAHDVRCALELFAADQTVARLSRTSVDELRRLSDDTVSLVRDCKFVDKHEYMLANKRFHEYIVDLAGNRLLSSAYRSLSLHELMECALAGPTTAAGTSSDDHSRIVAAYEAGDVQEARRAIIANVETGKRLALAAIKVAGGVL